MKNPFFAPGVWKSEGAKRLRSCMQPFRSEAVNGGDCLCCPWLEAWQRQSAPFRLPAEGVLLLQDWGVADSEKPEETERLEDAVHLLRACLEGELHEPPGSTKTDATLRNLLFNSKQGWSRAFTEGRWLITNAVWGLRPSGRKSGYLGRAIHKAAFPIWRELLISAAEANAHQSDGNTFTVVIAGGWGRFGSQAKNPTGLPGYIRAWEKYLKLQESEQIPAAKVIYARHPSMWRAWGTYPEMLAGPPKASRFVELGDVPQQRRAGM